MRRTRDRSIFARVSRELATDELRTLKRLWRTTDPAQANADFASKLSGQIESWIATADAADQPAMREFWNQLRFQLLIDSGLRALFDAAHA
ncbi:MAG: hypothetical protein QM811_19435 [Pirellulales bacterium]